LVRTGKQTDRPGTVRRVFHGKPDRPLKNVASDDEIRKNEAKKRRIRMVHEHFGVSQISADFELAYLRRIFATGC